MVCKAIMRMTSSPRWPATILERTQREIAPLTIAHFLLAVGLPLFAALIVGKAFALGTWQWRSIGFPLKLAIAAFPDLVFILGWMLLGGLGLWLARRLPTIRRVLRVVILIISVLIVVYGIANIWIYGALHVSLTYSPLVMAGSFEDVRSSIVSSSDAWTWPAIVLGPIAYLAAAVLLLLRQSGLAGSERRPWSRFSLRSIARSACSAIRACSSESRMRDWRTALTGRCWVPSSITGGATEV